MRTPFTTCRLAIALTAGAILAAPAAADEPYQRVTVAELKRIQKENEEAQRRLEATPEYQAKKRIEEEARKRREKDEFLAKENELKLRSEAADLERKRLENKRLANGGGGTSQGSSGGSGALVVVPPVVGVPRIAVYPNLVRYGRYRYYVPPARVYPAVSHARIVKRAPVIRRPVRVRR